MASSSADELFGTSTTGGAGVKRRKTNGKVKRRQIEKPEVGYEAREADEDLFADQTPVEDTITDPMRKEELKDPLG